MGDQSDLEKLSFEHAYSQLESIVRSLDSGRGGLEEALDEYEKGMALIEICRQKLDAASRRIERLKGIDEQGKPVTEELNEDDLKSLADVAGRHSASSAKSAPSTPRRRPVQNSEQSETLLPKEPDPRPEGTSRPTPRRKERSNGDFFGSTEPPF